MPPSRRLPRTVPLFRDETVDSFLARLAAANHLDIEELRALLDVRMLKKTPITELRPPLATVSGYTEHHLTLALPEFIATKRTDTPGLIDRPLPDSHNAQRPACRFCVHRAGITSPVICWMTHERNVCLRHLLWIGDGCQQPEDQVDITPLPDTVLAQRHHRNLIARHGRRWVGLAFHSAKEIFLDWKERYEFHPEEAVTRRLTALSHPSGKPVADDLALTAGFHPEIVRLSGLLASDHWERVALRKGGLASFLDEVSHRNILGGYEPEDRSDPLLKWVRDRVGNYNMALHFNRWEILAFLFHDETTRRLTKRPATDLRTCPLPLPHY
ncbi:TniQ family protein [Streptomyces javensis]|uniref:TniQ family protein n=1 Tax=Streptomyces javensis TaxID=114698 RepID=A0ABS0R2P5_9ACTN|nr:TniQ family protein [Streptomyces javensis]MBI0311658.1 TniQ family protein [Streptomyces javensis]